MVFSKSINNRLKQLEHEPKEFTETIIQLPTEQNITTLNRHYKKLQSESDKKIILSALEKHWHTCVKQGSVGKASTKLIFKTPLVDSFKNVFNDPFCYIRYPNQANANIQFIELIENIITHSHDSFLQEIATHSPKTKLAALIDAEIERRTSSIPLKQALYYASSLPRYKNNYLMRHHNVELFLVTIPFIAGLVTWNVCPSSSHMGIEEAKSFLLKTMLFLFCWHTALKKY